MDEGAAIETVLGAEQRQQIAAVALLDGALDDDEQSVGGRILSDNGFARTEVGDIQRRAQRLDLLRCEAVEGWVGGIEGVGQLAFPGQTVTGQELDGGRPNIFKGATIAARK